MLAVMDRFIDEQNRQQSQTASGALSFLSTQVAQARERLEAARKAESLFREEYSISSLDAENNIFTDAITQLSSAKIVIERQLSERQTLLRRAKSG